MRIHCSLARLTAIALATVAAVALPSPAHASLFPQVWQFTDGFEVDPSDTWSCWHSVEDPMFVNGCNIDSVVKTRRSVETWAEFRQVGIDIA